MLDAFVKVSVSLFFVLNALGNIPMFIALLGRFDIKKQRRIIFREFGAALAILLIFNFFGDSVLFALGVSTQTIGIAGGLLLLLIAISMVFPKPHEDMAQKEEPIIVPIAIPLLAGPGSISYVMAYSQEIHNQWVMTAAIFSVIIVSLCIILVASNIKRLLGPKGLSAISRFGGMLLALIACQMISSGIIELVQNSFNK